MDALGLYVHVPFCASICEYCNFTRDLRNAALEARYLRAVQRELAAAGAGRRAGRSGVDTIFFGGGTPSLLEPADLACILASCRTAFDVRADAEVTLEANPESLDVRRVEGYLAAGVTRLSIGVQSFRDDELARLGRAHDAARARQALAEARAAGCANISLDLMMWLPGQSVGQWMESVETLVELRPPHASLYILELYPNAPLRDTMARSGWSVSPDDDAAEMYEQAMERLDRAGYRQYEISNVAVPGFECRHNLKYWSDGEWIGVGPGAHSTVARTRWKNVPGIGDYVSRVELGRPTVADPRVLTPEEACAEAVITGLRLTSGIEERAFAEKFGLDLWSRYGDHLQPYLTEGLLARERGHLRLTRRGMLVANEILAVFI